MPRLKKYKKAKLVGLELDIFLTTGMGVFSWFNGKKIKFNPWPFSEKKKLDETEENLVDFHLEIVKKIDALIAEHGEETEFEELVSISQKQPEGALEEKVEMREPLKRKTEMSHFKTEMQSENILENVFDGLDFEDESFEIELPSGIRSNFKFVTNLEEPKDAICIKDIKNEHVKDEDFHSWMLGDQDKEFRNSAKGFARIKVRRRKEKPKLGAVKSRNKREKKTSSSQKAELKGNKKKTGKNNGVTRTKKEQKDKKGEKEMKKARREAKAKEKELREKSRMMEKKKRLEAKRAIKEGKLKRKILKEKNKKQKEKTKSSAPGLHRFILDKKEVEEENPILDEDIRKVLTITDNLLENLPDEVIDKFVQSKDFELYEKIINKYRIK